MLGAQAAEGQAADEGDGRLVRRVRAGDVDAFCELVERYKRRAYYAALGLVGSPEDAMDLAQEAFARAFRARRRLDPERSFNAWLYQIVRRLCFNLIRDRGRRSAKLRQASDWLVAQAQERAAERDDPERALVRAEERRRLMRAIEALSAGEREVIVLKELEGLRYREIAELVGIPLGTVMSRLYTARRRLRATLGETR